MKEGIGSLVRSIVAFYAATVGFGLSHLLALSPSQGAFYDHRWPCFMIVALLALRLLTGSSAHLGTEYPTSASPTVAGAVWFGVDVLFLLIFGFCALRSAYAASLEEFLGWCLALSISPLLGALTMLRNGGSWKKWRPFLISDLVISLAVGLAYLLYPGASDWPNLLGWHPTVVWTLAVSLLCTITEIPWQLYAAGQ